MPDLVLTGFPQSLLVRLDRYIQVLEKLNPGYKWSRPACVATLLSRALVDVEGAELKRRRRQGEDRRAEPRDSERREGSADRREGPDRRASSYTEMVDLVIEHLLREKRGIGDETWRDRLESPESADSPQ